jgi:raffinose/stachyose/melibiose transport system substrate-binding protein
MTKSLDPFAACLDRRRLLRRTGGLAASALLAGALGTRRGGSLAAQSATTLTIWGNHPEWKQPMTEILDAFTAANPGITFELTEIPGQEYIAKNNTAIAGGQTPDVLGLLEGDIVSTFAPAGDLPCVDLTGKVDLSGLLDSARGQVEVDGKAYGCPLASYTVGLAIQNPIFAKHGLTPPTTWDELKAVAQKLKDAGETPLVLGAKDWVHPYFMYIGLASSVLGPDGFEALRKGDRKLTDADVVAAAQLLIELQSFYNAGFQATDYVTAKAIFANEKGAMMVAGTADFTGYREVNPKADLSFIAWPGPEAGKYSTNTGMELLYTVSKTASEANQAAAATFVNWLATADAQRLVSDKIALPVHKDVTESSDPIRAETAAARGMDVIVWYDVPETNGSLKAVQDNHGGLWTGRTAPQQFAEIMQSIVKPSGS